MGSSSCVARYRRFYICKLSKLPMIFRVFVLQCVLLVRIHGVEQNVTKQHTPKIV